MGVWEYGSMGEKKVSTMKKEQVETCRLCLEEATLCNSHILSEFFYKPMYDEKHRALKFTREPYNRKYIQKGFREYLLCEKCEAHRLYVFMFGGCIWNYFVSSHPIDLSERNYITHKGNITLLKKEITEAKVITDFLVDILRSQNNRKSPKVT